MTVSTSVSESNSNPTTLATGTLSLEGGTVVGVAFAGSKTGNVGTAFAGIFGKLTVNANGSYSYALDNLDRDTQLLSTGETA